jgi:hypothetical protein
MVRYPDYYYGGSAMPVGEALFWLGISFFEMGQGLYFFTSNYRGTGIAFMIGGFTGIVTSVFSHHKPRMRVPPYWVLPLLFGGFAIAYDLHDRHTTLGTDIP